MASHRWFELQLSTSVDDFIGHLLSLKFSSERPFEIMESNSRFYSHGLDFRYFSKVKVPVSRLDVSGDFVTDYVDSYSNFEFSVFRKNKVFLRVDSPPRSLREFFSRVSPSIDFGFSVEPVFLVCDDFVNVAVNFFHAVTVGSPIEDFIFHAIGD